MMRVVRICLIALPALLLVTPATAPAQVAVAPSSCRIGPSLLTGTVARCYAGVGVVRDSDPSAELAETEVKLQALLPVLAS